jgi:hypothetical protein
MKLSLITLGALVGTVLSFGGASAAPTSFQLVFDGKHAPASFPTPSGLQHEGPFTTSSPLCPSGTARDVASLGADYATRVFTCNGSDAEFTARVGPLLGEHGGGGSWQIVSGTGELVDFRGRGIWQSVRLAGNDSDPATIGFRTTWQGVAAMDATPPTIALPHSGTQKLERPAGTVRINLRLSIADGSGDAVSYTVSFADTRNASVELAQKSGQTTTGTVSLAILLKPPKMTRVLQLKIVATDVVGNEGFLVRSLRLG